VAKADFSRIVAALNLLSVSFAAWTEDQQPPSLMPLIHALESRLAQSGGMNAVVPQNSAALSPPVASPIDRLVTGYQFRPRFADQAKTLPAT
jgi:type VI secretion system protein VasJ